MSDHKHNHPHVFNSDKAGKLLEPERREKLPPDRILDLFGLNQGDTSADLGAGNGFFTVPMAKRTDKKVYAVDIEPKMLAELKVHAERENVDNIEYITGSLADTTLKDHSITKLFSSFVMHEVPNLKEVLNEMSRILTNDGKGLILDWEAVESEIGPPLHVRIPSGQLKEAFEDYGFKTQLNMINEEVYALIITR